jgi:hypothetical protein
MIMKDTTTIPQLLKLKYFLFILIVHAFLMKTSIYQKIIKLIYFKSYFINSFTVK